MTYILLTHAAAVAIGGASVWLALRPRLDRLRRLTDRDARGRFVRKEPK